MLLPVASALLVLGLALPAAAAAPVKSHQYSVRVDAELSRLDVRACFVDGLPDQLQADHFIAARATTEMRLLLQGELRRFRPPGNIANFRRQSDDDCLEWSTDLEVVAAQQRMTQGYRAGNSLLLQPGSWLWRPWYLGDSRDIEVRFELPEGMSVSLPWQPTGDEQPATRFRTGLTRPDWPALMAIGQLQHGEIEVPGGRLRVAVADGPAPPRLALALRWLRPAALAVTAMTGEFPRPAPQVLVVPLDNGRDAAPWAQVNRGGGAAAHFFMNTRADWSVFVDDWIAVHELAHLALPYVRRADAWLPEGIASYYQNLLRARIGLLGERQAWQKLHDGFRRGQRNTGSANLRDIGRSGNRRGNSMRIYWTGAAIALLGDLELRARSEGRWSLDRLIAELQSCCMDDRQRWSARELLAWFDQRSGEDVFLPLYERHVHSRHFPRLDEAYRRLGISVDKDDRVRLLGEAPAAGIRRAITSAPPGDAEPPDE